MKIIKPVILVGNFFWAVSQPCPLENMENMDMQKKYQGCRGSTWMKLHEDTIIKNLNLSEAKLRIN